MTTKKDNDSSKNKSDRRSFDSAARKVRELLRSG